MEHFVITHQDINLELRAAGPAAGPVVILLHGFPENWSTWRHQIQPLADAGYRVLVPNMRGYGESSKPKDFRRYRLDELITDIEAIRLHSGAERIHLAGHDWGAAVAWWYALHHEEKLKSLSILNVPHPLAFLHTLKRSPLQMLKSWYIFYFQLPLIPQLTMRIGNGAVLRRILKASSNPGSYSAEDFRLLGESWQQPGCMTAMVNYYRAMLRCMRIPEGDGKLNVPVRILWGEQDIALSVGMARDSMAYLNQGELVMYPDATHWLAHDKPQQVVQQLLQHFSSVRD